ncbi:unnamed protein product (macronuclear) [Paramecium tetraurelia]|uniref:Transmembrane protein n=1 Tax=Paramecium tetraurelia TaxID=5888 RepID=A0DZ67_PARTE|nr:uncharacterized protein GSPATT00003303001 [Paramecium tetraurelia]CAK88334.1 unnamed protein product [Paramecium tetraurelia]|eukprot:XP_001455731.1 hypothetical protein (macronuclear) [Paramecium tetraurelia strain d4-2]
MFLHTCLQYDNWVLFSQYHLSCIFWTLKSISKLQVKNHELQFILLKTCQLLILVQQDSLPNIRSCFRCIFTLAFFPFHQLRGFNILIEVYIEKYYNLKEKDPINNAFDLYQRSQSQIHQKQIILSYSANGFQLICAGSRDKLFFTLNLQFLSTEPLTYLLQLPEKLQVQKSDQLYQQSSMRHLLNTIFCFKSFQIIRTKSWSIRKFNIKTVACCKNFISRLKRMNFLKILMKRPWSFQNIISCIFEFILESKCWRFFLISPISRGGLSCSQAFLNLVKQSNCRFHTDRFRIYALGSGSQSYFRGIQRFQNLLIMEMLNCVNYLQHYFEQSFYRTFISM